MLPIRRFAIVGLVWMAVAGSAGAQLQERTLRLSIGDASLRDKDVPVVLDGITHTSTGEVIAPGDLPARLADVRLLLLGEAHTSVESHRVQRRVIEVLSSAGRRVLVGLEMFPHTQQVSLDHWSEGLLTEQGFVKLSNWYEHWGYNWQYYREIFLLARERGLPLVAVNTPRDVVEAVRRKGLDGLTADQAKHLPPGGVDVESADHMTLFRASFDEGDTLHGGGTEDLWQRMLSAQATWDATMGWNALQALERVDDPRAIMVVLVGSGHVAYDLGIARQAKRWFDGGIASLIPVPVAVPERGVTIEAVRASYATFVWGVPPEANSSFPILGISTRAGEDGHRVVIQVEKQSAAARAGFEEGDVVLSMDGHPLPDRETFNALMSQKAWGDAATFVVRRGEDETTLTAYFRRTPPQVRPGPPQERHETAATPAPPPGF